MVLASWLLPVLLGVSVLLLGNSFYLLYVKKRGSRWSIVITWLSTVIVIGFWTWRLTQ